VCIQVSKSQWNEALDVLKCSWQDGYTRHKYYFLRIFYRLGPALHETIGIADFVPEMVCDTSTWDPVPEYEGYETVVDKANQWLQHCKDIRVTNTQTLDTKYLRKAEYGGQRLDTLRTINHKIESRARVMFLRVAYVLTEDRPEQHSFIPTLTCRTFLPAVVADKTCCGGKDYQFETMKETMHRVEAWLNETGVQILCAETVAVPQWYIDQPDNTEHSVYSGEWYLFKNREHRHKLVYFIRLYFCSPFREPDPRRLPPPPEVLSPTYDCNIL